MTKEDYIIIELPMPPSLNSLFKTNKNWWKSKSKEYVDWLKLADEEFSKIKMNYKIIWDDWLYAELNYFFSLYTLEWNKRVKDTANYEKAVIDFLSGTRKRKWKIEWLSDHKIKRITQEKHDSKLDICKIMIKEIN